MNIAQGCAAQADCRRHIRQAALHQHDIRGINGNIRSGADRHSDIRPCKRRRVIDSIADHDHFALFLQFSYHLLLAVRKHAGDHLVHSGLQAHRPGRALIVAGQHNHVDPHVL